MTEEEERAAHRLSMILVLLCLLVAFGFGYILELAVQPYNKV